MKNVTWTVKLPDGQEASIETYCVAPDAYQAFWKQLVFTHDDREFVVHGLLRLVMESGSYFDQEPIEMLGDAYKAYDISNEHRFIHWITVTGKKGKKHLAGVLEWIPISTREVVIYRLFVLKQFRRRGIATALLAEAVRQIMQQGYSFLAAAVRLEPESGRKFLVAHDFCRIAKGIYKRSLRTSNDIFFAPEDDPIFLIKE